MLRLNTSKREWLFGADIRRIGMTNTDAEKTKVKLWLTLPLIIAASNCAVMLYLNQL